MGCGEDNEKKKAYLKQYQAKEQAVKDLELEIERLRLEQMYPAAVIGDGMPHVHNQRDLSGYAAALADAYEQLVKLRCDRIKCYTGILKRIEEMEDETEKRALRLRYIRGMTWEKAAAEMGYSWKQIHRIHSRALENFKMT